MKKYLILETGCYGIQIVSTNLNGRRYFLNFEELNEWFNNSYIQDKKWDKDMFFEDEKERDTKLKALNYKNEGRIPNVRYQFQIYIRYEL